MFADFLSSFLAVFQGIAQYRGLLFSILTLFVFWVVYKLLTRGIKRYFRRKDHGSSKNLRSFLLVFRYAWIVLAVVFTIVSLSGSLATLGISAAFFGMVLGWSLQDSITGIAAWFMIVLKRPFRVGDRVIISGITGDVVDLTLTHVVLNQVGGTIGGEERSGRGVLIPNAMLFKQIIHNYAFEDKFLLDEVSVLITYKSDFHRAEEILLQSAREVVGHIIKETKQEPFVRVEFADAGIRMRLRYKTFAMDRQRISSDIAKRVIEGFKGEQNVAFV